MSRSELSLGYVLTCLDLNEPIVKDLLYAAVAKNVPAGRTLEAETRAAVGFGDNACLLARRAKALESTVDDVALASNPLRAVLV